MGVATLYIANGTSWVTYIQGKHAYGCLPPQKLAKNVLRGKQKRLFSEF